MKGDWSIASVTVTTNPGRAIEGHIQALLRQTCPIDEIVIVDNASTDGTQEFLRAEFPAISVLPQAKNVGVSGAYSAGLKYAYAKGHDWVWLFDEDSRPAPSALEELLAAFKSMGEGSDEIGVLACLPVQAGGTTEHAGLLWRNRLVPAPSGSTQEPICFVDSVISSGSLIRRAVVEKVGLPREDFFMDFVDHEYNLRIRKMGFKIAVVRASILSHQLGEVYRVRNFPRGKFRMRSRQPTWRHYFMSRNEAFTVWHLLGNAKSRAFLFLRFFRRAASIIWYDRDKLAKLRMHITGFVDGLAANLNKRTAPFKPRSRP